MSTRAARSNWLLASLLLMVSVPVDAQIAPRAGTPAPPGRLGVGLQAGPFSGLTVKGYTASGAATAGPFESASVAASLNLDGFALVQVVLLDETALEGSPLTLYLGPGSVIEIDDGKITAGLAAAAGARFVKARFEFFLELAPRLMVLGELEAFPAAAVGFRFYP